MILYNKLLSLFLVIKYTSDICILQFIITKINVFVVNIAELEEPNHDHQHVGGTGEHFLFGLV